MRICSPHPVGGAMQSHLRGWNRNAHGEVTIALVMYKAVYVAKDEKGKKINNIIFAIVSK